MRGASRTVPDSAVGGQGLWRPPLADLSLTDFVLGLPGVRRGLGCRRKCECALRRGCAGTGGDPAGYCGYRIPWRCRGRRGVGRLSCME